MYNLIDTTYLEDPYNNDIQLSNYIMFCTWSNFNTIIPT